MATRVRLHTMLSLVVALASPAYAQTPPSDDPFCSTAPAALLAALDGSWNLTQGPGSAWAKSPLGVVAIPLPAPPQVSLVFRYEPSGEVVVVNSADLEDEMIMVPAGVPEQQTPLLTFSEQVMANAISDDGPPAGNCDWYALPILIGTNFYSVTGITRSKAVPEGIWRATDFLYAAMAPVLCELWSQPGVEEYFGSLEIYTQTKCYEETEPISGNMRMTMFLRFSDTDNGAGTVFFAGVQDGSTFGAIAPIRLSR